MDTHGISSKRIVVAASTLALVLALVGIQVYSAPVALAAAVSVSPPAGAPDTRATVSGSAFTPLVPVDLCWDGEGCSGLGSTIPDGTGEFSVAITIPSAAAPGGHSIAACQIVTGCVTTGFVVLEGPDDSSTVPTTGPTTTTTRATTTTKPTTTTTAPTTTSSSTTTTTLPPAGPPTTSPPQTPGTTGATGTSVVAAAAQQPTTTSTTDPGEPLVEAAAAAPTLDIEALIAGLFAPEPPVEDEVLGLETGPAWSMAAAPAEVEEGEEDDDGPSLALEAPGPGFTLPQFGIWIVWLLAIIASTALVLAGDEMRRRRRG